jgi:hypothetical protein
MQSEAGAFRTTLEGLGPALADDVQTVLHPLSDSEGKILRQDELIAISERATRVAKKIASFAVPSSVYDESVNTLLPTLFLAADSFASGMERVTACAKQMPSTVEEYFMLLGPLALQIERGSLALSALIAEVVRALRQISR